MMTRYRTKCLVLSLWSLLGLATANAQVQTATLEYWLDTHFNERISLPISDQLEQQIDVSQLSAGIHTLEMRVSDTNGRWGAPLVRYFLKSETRLEGNALAHYEYCIDGQWGNSVKGMLTEGEAILDLDISRLCSGMHSLMLRAYDAKGLQSQTLLRYFLALGEDASLRQLTSYRYWVDDFVQAQEGQTTDGNIMLDIDVSSLSKGLHSFGYQVADNSGRLSSPRLLYFVIPDLEEGSDLLVAYEYWFNHGPRKRVELEPQQSINATDWLIEVKDVVPDRIPTEYIFDTTTGKISFRDDVFFGMQVFNGNGKGSQAVLSDTVNIELSIAPEMFELADGCDIRFASPKGGAIMGWKTNCLAGDSVTYHLTSDQVHAAFFSADGQRLAVNKTTDGNGMICYGVVPHNEMCYMLLCNAIPDSLGFSIEVTNAMQGDVNGDKVVGVTDVVMTIDYVLVKNPEGFNPLVADVNHDDLINVADIVTLIDVVLEKITLVRDDETVESSVYTAFQMDLTIPAGYVLENVSLTEIAKNSHVLAYNMLSDGKYRVIVCSMSNEALPGAWDEVIRLHLKGQGEAQIGIENALFVTIGGECHELNLNATTAIDQIPVFRLQSSDLYDLMGRKVTGTLKKGPVYIINGKKASMK